MSILEEGPIRKRLREKGFLKRGLLSSPQEVKFPFEIDRELEAMREAKKREWKAKGYPEGLVEKALMLSDGWVSSLAATWAPPDRPDIREAIIRNAYPKALSVGEAWIIAMSR